jgi:serine protein kinase
MGGKMPKKSIALHQHLAAVKDGQLRFENAFQGVSRMILESEIEKVVVNGKTTYDFKIFRNGSKHIIGMYNEINSFVSYLCWLANRAMAKRFLWSFWPANIATFWPRKKTASLRLNS